MLAEDGVLARRVGRERHADRIVLVHADGIQKHVGSDFLNIQSTGRTETDFARIGLDVVRKFLERLIGSILVNDKDQWVQVKQADADEIIPLVLDGLVQGRDDGVVGDASGTRALCGY